MSGNFLATGDLSLYAAPAGIEPAIHPARTRAAVPADHEAMLRHPREVVHMMTSLLIYMMGKLAVAVAGFEPAAAAL